MNKENTPQGKLIMAANSLGLPEDIPARSLEAVRDADLLIFEEDRPARVVLKAAGVHREYLKYNEQHQADTLEELRDAFTKGLTVVYMSDQGCPTLEDPGDAIVKLAKRCKAKVKVIPGPSALTAALSACPFAGKSFEFHGFPPREETKRTEFLKRMIPHKKLHIVMDTPYRLKQVVETCESVFTENCRGFIALDISGPDEDYLLGSFTELNEEVKAIDKKLNFVLIILPAQGNSSEKTKPTPQKEKNKRSFKKRRR